MIRYNDPNNPAAWSGYLVDLYKDETTHLRTLIMAGDDAVDWNVTVFHVNVSTTVVAIFELSWACFRHGNTPLKPTDTKPVFASALTRTLDVAMAVIARESEYASSEINYATGKNLDFNKYIEWDPF